MIDTKTKYASSEVLKLDPFNPRLGRHNIEKELSQPKLLEIMQDWLPEELGISFIENSFWPQEALLVVKEVIGKKEELVVVEGNRRLAALKLLFSAYEGKPISEKWREIAKGLTKSKFEKLQNIPYFIASSRKEVQAYLGFRHVTGIKEWEPAEKAQFIANLIDNEGMSFDEVRRKIGSKTNIVKQHYVSYRILLQMDSVDNKISVKHVEDKFSVLYLSLRTNGVKQYLGIDITSDKKDLKKPIPKEHLDNLVKFAQWLFGTDKKPPIISDSRLVDQFGIVLESEEAVEYLERSDNPQFEVAHRMAGGDEIAIRGLIDRASDNLEQALARVHFYTKSNTVEKAVTRLTKNVDQLLVSFPAIKKEIFK